MKRKSLKQAWILTWLMSFYFISYTQEEVEVNKIASTLEEELKKAGVSIRKSTIQLSQVSHRDAKKYDLNDKPEDAFCIKTNHQSLDIRSQSIDGLRNGVYWYLHYLGFRFYFPGETWQYIPQLQTALKPVEKTVAPSFSHRRIWYAYGTGSAQADKDYKEWADANMLGGTEVNAGHSYEGIVNRSKNVFLQHPEYFAQKVEKGKIPPNPKFEPGNEELVQLIIHDAFAQIETKKKKTGQLPDMISMDPSDGGGFSTSASALRIGGASEQTFYIANRVAKAVRAKYPSIKIGLYAYNFHAAPPNFELEPNIAVLVATAMNQSAYRTDELIGMWKKKGVEVGIRDYYGVMAWDWDMPGQPKGAKLTYVNQLKDYYKTGIRFFTAETNIGWISRGLGHYIASQLLWNVEADADKIQDEFFENMFGDAEDEMEDLFKSWQKYSQAIPLDGDLYEWGQLLEKAEKKDINTDIRQRIGLVKQYLHYVFLFKKWKESSSDDNLIKLLNYAYRVQDKGIVASYPLFRRIANAAVIGKENMRFNDPKAKWKQDNRPLSVEEMERNFQSAMNSLNRGQKQQVITLPVAQQFKKRIQEQKKNKPAAELKTSSILRLRGIHKILLQVGEGDAFINVSSGLIKAHQYKTLRLSVYPYQKDLNTEGQTPLINETIEPRQPLKAISLKSLPPGIYIAVVDDAKNGFSITVTGDISYAIVASSRNKTWTFSRNNLVFAVNHVKEFQVQNAGAITLLSPAGRVIDLQKQKGIFTIQVQKGEEGMWKIQRQSGVFYLQGILPFVSSSAEFLLLKED
ncbi:DUF4838 domain-containing protein [Terrimonas alba]|uniref:DUF4838 domain-containing protein n=1 Tax=Terrimonas alba TaxID=3349636 RepID=UPI0035F4BBFF